MNPLVPVITDSTIYESRLLKPEKLGYILPICWPHGLTGWNLARKPPVGFIFTFSTSDCETTFSST